MKTRVISGLVMLPLLAVVYFGGWPLFVAVALVMILGIKEFLQGFKSMGINSSPVVPYISIAALLIIGALNYDVDYRLISLWMVGSIIASMLYMFNIQERKPEDSMATILGIIYVGFFSFHVVLVDRTEYDILTWMIFITAFGSDIMAYFTGYFLGKHKLAPVLSPKKTIEGAVGGVIGSMALSALFSYFFAPAIMIHCIIMGFFCSILSMCGDLTASAFKRKMGIKDYGNLIPGHGGIMDRFDSVLFTAPAIFYYIIFFIQ
ncbi:MAG: phosphatidate cytidylyltransferase [Peptostreptococcaceae bacterium]|nr:phosphatidate cytidylyltransferase [Peptostreptococcaceae bacterium]MDY5739668.1 phosphatidate cytidylyltransferase [Anaerovoracaceae bacterium]